MNGRETRVNKNIQIYLNVDVSIEAMNVRLYDTTHK
jgi:hypothetical protein